MLGVFRRRRLLHWDVPDAPYFVTTCLAGSIPAAGMKELNEYRRELDQRVAPPGVSSSEWAVQRHKLYFAKVDSLLDGEPAVRHFDDVRAADCIKQSVYHFAGRGYHLIAYCVMPSHLHWVFQPIRKWTDSLTPAQSGRTPREIIVHSLKSFTARQCNTLLSLQGEFWQEEAYDHWIRNDDELDRIVAYVEHNPVKSGLVRAADAWRWSSAWDRKHADRSVAGGLLVSPS